MSNDEQENPFENSIGKLSRYFSNSDDATQLLVGNLVTFLIEKKVIDLNEYIEFTENSKNRILEKIENDIDGDMSLVIGKVFDWHINDFNKPD